MSAGRRGDAVPATTEFIGRHAELRNVNALLDSGNSRLITLVGPGGIGKTRLAAEMYRQYRALGRTDIHWARLTRLPTGANSGIVAEEIARSIARIDTAGGSAWDVLIDTLARPTADNRTVLVLDNCEHVLDGAGPLIVNLLQALPTLVIVATSREPMGWIDEHIVPVPPLSTAQAVILLTRRAQLVGRLISASTDQHLIAEHICARVDNNPLYIRLAAARLRHLEPEALLNELAGGTDDKMMDWSEPNADEYDLHHRAVRDVIGWSYDLCTDPERLLMDRLSVFAPGFETDDSESRSAGVELDAIEAVCCDAQLPPEHVEALLERLTERSLVSIHYTPTTVRYYLLESVRVFAAEQLRSRHDNTDVEALSQRHRRYFRDMVVTRKIGWFGIGEQDWLEWIMTAGENILQAIETCLHDPHEAVLGLEIAVALLSTRAPFVTGSNRAVTRLTEQALDATRSLDAAPTDLRIDATATVAWIALWQGRQAYTAQLLEECAAACVRDPAVRDHWRNFAATDIGLPASVEFAWGQELILVELDPHSVDVLRRARIKFERAGDIPGAKRSELYEALARSIFSKPAQALRIAEHYLSQAQSSGSEEEIAWAQLTWLIALTYHGDPAEATRVGRELIEKRLAVGDSWTSGMLAHYVMFAAAKTLLRRMETGARHDELLAMATEIAVLQGGVATLHRALGFAVRRTPLVGGEIEFAINVAKTLLGQNYATVAERGARLRPEADELQHYVLGTLALTIDDHPHVEPDTKGPTSRWSALSSAEADIAILAAAGWSNKAIAEYRATSVRTVDSQVASIRQKLLVATRSDIIWHIPDEFDSRVRRESERQRRRVSSR